MKTLFLFICLFGFTITNTLTAQNNTNTFSYLAIGDSYTTGAGICDTCAFPEQLKKMIEEKMHKQVNLKTIAEPGWTTADVTNTLPYVHLSTNYDLVTLLIGVNNQYQGLSISKFKRQFPEIIDQAIAAAQGDASKVIVLSLPDYAYTPSTYGTGNQKKVTRNINAYNEYIKFIVDKRGSSYYDITKTTRLGIADPSLVAKDGLHLSATAHKRFAAEIYETAKRILKNYSR